MPRRNNHPSHTPYTHTSTDARKRRFATERQAQQAADERMLLTPDLELTVYKGIDGGWYLTSRTSYHTPRKSK